MDTSRGSCLERCRGRRGWCCLPFIYPQARPPPAPPQHTCPGRAELRPGPTSHRCSGAAELLAGPTPGCSPLRTGLSPMLWKLYTALDRDPSGMSSASRYPEYQAHTEANKRSTTFRMPGDRRDTMVTPDHRCPRMPDSPVHPPWTPTLRRQVPASLLALPPRHGQGLCPGSQGGPTRPSLKLLTRTSTCWPGVSTLGGLRLTLSKPLVKPLLLPAP